MSGRLEDNTTLLNALHDNKPFLYAHLVKFERPVNTIAAGSDNVSRELDSTKFAYLTDGAFDIVFDDGSTYKNTSNVVTANGQQTYIANKLVSVGAFSESTDLKVTSSSITLDATTVDASITDSFSVAVGGSSISISSTNYSFSEEGFREGDTFKFSSGSNAANTYRIDSVYNAGKTVLVTETTSGTTTAHTATSLTINIESQEINGLLHSTATDKVSFINRQVSIYKAFFYADAPHTFIGTPLLLFKGTVTSATFEEDPQKGARVTWSISNFLADFRRVKGRITSHEAHQGYTTEGGVSGENALRAEYALDRGFEYSEVSLNLLATYADTEQETRYKKKRIFFGLFGSVQEPYQVDVPVTREVDLRFDLQAKYIPVVYGVQRVKGLPVFADLSSSLTAEKETKVYVNHVISEGPIQSILNVFVDDNALICMSEDDAKARDPNNTSSSSSEAAEAQNADIKCIGRADSGQVLIGGTATGSPQTHVISPSGYSPRSVETADAYGFVAEAGELGYVPTFTFDFNAPGFAAGDTGLTHEKSLKFTSPIDGILEAHMGLRSQTASSMLTTVARSTGFKLQGQAGTGDYYTEFHQLLDTAYVSGEYVIGKDQTSIPSLEFIVKGKMIEAFNYDGSYKHSVLPLYSSEAHTNFKQGDTVTLYAAANFTSTKTKLNSSSELVLIGDGVGEGETAVAPTSGAAIVSSKKILDKFYFIDNKGTKQYRFRWDLSVAEQTLLGEAKRFYMSDGSNEWHMVSYDTEDTISTDLDTLVTVAEVLTADLTQTSTGSDTFEATMTNTSVVNTADYTVTDANLVFFVEDSEVAFGAGSYEGRSALFKGNIANITGGTAIQIPNTTSTTAIPANTKVVVANQLKFSTSASTTDDIYNGQNVIFTRILSAAEAKVAGVDRIRMERTIIDYEGSTRLATLDSDISAGLPKVGDIVTLVSETSDRPNTEEDVVKAGDLRPSTNFALITLDYIRSRRYGLQMELKDINLNDFLLAAVECDTSSDVTVTFNSSVTATAGAVYEYVVGGHLKWRGTVKSVDGTSVEFTNCYGKLTNKWNDYSYREVGDLVYDKTANDLFEITSAGVQATATSNASAASSPALSLVSGTGDASIQLDSTLLNPVTEYSLYDSDDITYWKYLGWEEPRQRYVTRHQGNITLDTSKPQLDTLKSLLAHFNAYMYPSNGKMRLQIEAGRATDGENSDANFNDSNADVDVKVRYITNDDIIGKINLKDQGLSKSYNTVSASISDPSINFDDRSVSFIDSTYKKEDNGIIKSANFSMPGITNYYNARMAAKQTLDRSRFSREVSFTMRPAGIGILPGQLIRINYPRFGWDTGYEVIFRVRTVSVSKDCLVSITALEYNDSIYLIDKNVSSPFFVDKPITQVSRTPGAPGNVDVDTGSDASPNVVSWTAAAGISEETGYYEIWRATTFSGDAGTDVTAHATLIGEAPSKELTFPDINVTSATAQEFIYWVRAYNQSAPQTTSGVKRGFKRYYGPFNDDSDYGGVGQAAAAKADLKAVEEAITIRFGRGNTVSIPADSSGNISDYSPAGATILVFVGNTDITSQVTSFVISNETNISGSISGTSYTVASMTADLASLRITANIPAGAVGLAQATSVFGDISFSKARDGADGADGAAAADAYTVRGDNESHTFVADTTGAASMTGFSCDFTVFKGAQAYSYDGSSPYAANSFRYGTIVATNVTQSVSGTGQITLQSGSAIATGLTVISGSLLVPIIDNATGTTVASPLIGFSKSIQASRDGGVFIFEESTNGSISAANAAAFAGTLDNAAAQAAAAAVIAASSDGFIRPNDRVTISDTSADLAGTRVYTGSGTASSGSVGSSDFSSLIVEVFDGSVIVDGTLSADKLLANTTTTNTLNIGSDLIVANSGKIHSVNKSGYSDTDAGFFLGWDGSNHAVNIGNASNFLKWNGTSLEVSGTLNVTSGQISTALGYTPTDDTAADAAQATADSKLASSDVTQSFIEGKITDADSFRSDIAAYASSNPSGFTTFAATDVQNAITNNVTTIDGSKITTGTLNAANVNVINLNASNISSGTVSTARLNVSEIISTGSIIVSGSNVSSLTNDSGFTTFGATDVQNAITNNVTTIDGGKITTGTVAAARIDVSGIISAGGIIVSGDNITSLTNNAGFTDDTAADAAQATADSKVAPLEVNTNVTSIEGGVITTGVINLGNASGMAIRQGKTGYSSTTNGFWLGNDGGTPKFNIGDASDFMRWTGTQLEISGIVTAQAGSTIALLEISYPDALHQENSSTVNADSGDYTGPTISNGSGNYSYSWRKVSDLTLSDSGDDVDIVANSTSAQPTFEVNGLGTTSGQVARSVFEVQVTDTTSSEIAKDLMQVSLIRGA
jgi:hypothetical protein